MKSGKTNNGLEKRPAESICYRLDKESAEVLDKRATAMGISVHELARAFLLEALMHETNLTELNYRMDIIREDFAQLREDLAFAVEVLLARAGKVTEANARDWINREFKPIPKPKLEA